MEGKGGNMVAITPDGQTIQQGTGEVAGPAIVVTNKHFIVVDKGEKWKPE